MARIMIDSEDWNKIVDIKCRMYQMPPEKALEEIRLAILQVECKRAIAFAERRAYNQNIKNKTADKPSN